MTQEGLLDRPEVRKRPRARAARPYETGREAGGEPDYRRIGVVWHTRGSGKSLTMTCCVGRALANRRCHRIDLVTRAIAPERAWG
jgi:type I site-specific restriction-modification system R (restriction) subunit